MDTSMHAWLENRSTEEIVLVAMIDDATSCLTARFFPKRYRGSQPAAPHRLPGALRAHGCPLYRSGQPLHLALPGVFQTGSFRLLFPFDA